MHIHFLDPFREGDSPVHRLDPRVKFILVVSFIFTTALTPAGAWPVYLLLLSLVLSVEVGSGLGIGYVLKRALLALPFVLAAFPLVFTLPGDPLFTFTLGTLTVTITQPGVERFLSIALKSWISVQAAILLASTTSFPDVLTAMRAVKIPSLLVSIFGLMWRYLFVLADEALRLLRARQARSGQTDRPGLKSGGSIPWRGRVAGGMAGSLFLRAFERSDRIYMAMVARGYDGDVHSSPLPALQPGSKLLLSASLVLFFVLLAAAVLFWS